MYEICENTFLKENLCVLQVFVCALISRPVCTRTQLRGNIDCDMKLVYDLLLHVHCYYLWHCVKCQSITLIILLIIFQLATYFMRLCNSHVIEMLQLNRGQVSYKL